MERLYVLASCVAEVHATIPRILDVFEPSTFRKDEVRFISRADQLRGLENIVIIELAGWEGMKRNPTPEECRIQEQINILGHMGRIRLWLKEVDIKRG